MIIHFEVPTTVTMLQLMIQGAVFLCAVSMVTDHYFSTASIRQVYLVQDHAPVCSFMP